MAHYAFLNENNVVTHVIPGVDEWDTIDGIEPESWYATFTGQTCRRTSYNTYAGQHANGGTPYRLNYAGIGYTYDTDLDGFIPPQPFLSWSVNPITGLWDPPVPYPTDGGDYTWNETDQTWEPIDNA